MPYAILGWTSLGLLALLILPFVLVRLNKWVLKTKSKPYQKLIRFLRMLHKPAGIALLLVAAVHGYLALGTLRLHTGTVLFAVVLLTAVLGGAFYRLKKKPLFSAHKLAAVLTVLVFLLHFFLPRLFN